MRKLILLLLVINSLSMAQYQTPTVTISSDQTSDEKTVKFTSIEKTSKDTTKLIKSLANKAYMSMYKDLNISNKYIKKAGKSPLSLKGTALYGAEISKDDITIFAEKKNGPTIDFAQDLLWAMMYVNQMGTKGIAFSLEPKDPSNLKLGHDAMYYPFEEAIAPFPIGKRAYDADMQMKAYTMNMVYNTKTGKTKKMTNKIKGYKSMLDIEEDAYINGDKKAGSIRSRFWIVCDSVYITEDKNSMIIDSVSVRIDTRKQAITADNRLVDIPVNDPSSQKFAKWFTNNYKELSKKHPELNKLVESTKAIAIASWLNRKKSSLSNKWLAANVIPDNNYKKVGSTLSKERTFSRTIDGKKKKAKLKVSGGAEITGNHKSTNVENLVIENELKKDRLHKKKSNSSITFPKQLVSNNSDTKSDKIILKNSKIISDKNDKIVLLSGNSGIPLVAKHKDGMETSFTRIGTKATEIEQKGTKYSASVSEVGNGDLQFFYEDKEYYIQGFYAEDNSIKQMWYYAKKAI